MPEQQSNPAAEAKGMVSLLKTGETVEGLRALIGTTTPYRVSVLNAFDAAVARLGKKGKPLHNMQFHAVSDRLRSQVSRRLRQGLSQKQIEKAVPVSQGFIQELSKQTRASWSKLGRGRRISPEMKQTITERIKNGAKSIDLEREFSVCSHTVRKWRRALNDREDRRRRKKLTKQQIEQATAQLRSGSTWRAVAWSLGVNERTLSLCVSFRKRRNHE
jgi:transposase-like protein